MSDVDKLLRQISAQTRFAQEAIADEHEGDLRAAITLIVSDAARLAELVSAW